MNEAQTTTEAETDGVPVAGALTVVTTGRSAVPGVLSWQAWDAVRRADVVLVADTVDPQWLVAFADAAVRPEQVDVGDLTGLVERLSSIAHSGRRVVWFGSADGDEGLARSLTERLVVGVSASDGGEAGPPEIEVVAGAWDRPGSAVLELVAVMDRLRSPGGCPWDAEQTHRSLVPYVLEEAYEVAEAIESGGRDDVVEELGDLLLQVVFHARVGEEGDQPFNLDQVADGISAKLRRRHPHVFADVHAPTAAHVEANWEAIKQAEKGRTSAFDGIPVTLPALARAEKVIGRCARAELTFPLSGLLRLLTEQTAEASHDQAAATGPESATELADAVLRLVADAVEAGVDLEAAVRERVRELIELGRSLEAADPAAR